ncbi:hypothetical protein ES703_90670 [subsurface metagenome]
MIIRVDEVFGKVSAIVSLDTNTIRVVGIIYRSAAIRNRVEPILVVVCIIINCAGIISFFNQRAVIIVVIECISVIGKFPGKLIGIGIIIVVGGITIGDLTFQAIAYKVIDIRMCEVIRRIGADCFCLFTCQRADRRLASRKIFYAKNFRILFADRVFGKDKGLPTY